MPHLAGISRNVWFFGLLFIYKMLAFLSFKLIPKWISKMILLSFSDLKEMFCYPGFSNVLFYRCYWKIKVSFNKYIIYNFQTKGMNLERLLVTVLLFKDRQATRNAYFLYSTVLEVADLFNILNYYALDRTCIILGTSCLLLSSSD